MAKYIKTRDGNIIIFSDAMNHSDFEQFNPVSAGGVFFYSNKDGDVFSSCFGNSFSLDLKSDKNDSNSVDFQILES